MMSENQRDDMARFDAEQDIVLDVQFMLLDLIAERGLTRAQAAKLAGISSARFSQLMRADANPTLRNVAGLFLALGDKITVERKSQRKRASKYEGWDALMTDGRLDGMAASKPLDSQLIRLVNNLRPSAVGNDNSARDERMLMPAA